jgi:hypothetical protein
MTLSPCSDLSAAAWVTSGDQPWEQLVMFGPWGFDAYARLQFLPDPLYDGQPENDVQVDGGALFEHEPLRTALDVLEHHTQTPDDCYDFCLWDGWPLDGRDAAPPLPRMAPAFPPSVLDGPKVVIPNRAYFLFRGGLADFGDWGAADLWPGRPRTDMPAPAFI